MISGTLRAEGDGDERDLKERAHLPPLMVQRVGRCR